MKRGGGRGKKNESGAVECERKSTRAQKLGSASLGERCAAPARTKLSHPPLCARRREFCLIYAYATTCVCFFFFTTYTMRVRYDTHYYGTIRAGRLRRLSGAAGAARPDVPCVYKPLGYTPRVCTCARKVNTRAIPNSERARG